MPVKKMGDATLVFNAHKENLLNNNSSESSTSLSAEPMINLLVKNFDSGGVNRPLMQIKFEATVVVH